MGLLHLLCYCVQLVLVVACHAGVCPRASLVVSLLLVYGFRGSKKPSLSLRDTGKWQRPIARGRVRYLAWKPVMGRSSKDAGQRILQESWVRANMRLWSGNGQSRELCTGLVVLLV